MELLKDRFFNPDTLLELSHLLKNCTSPLDQKNYYEDLILNLDELELMERLRQITTVTHKHIPGSYQQQIEILSCLAPTLKMEFYGMFLSDFVQVYGLDDVETSLRALESFTQHGSAEFAIRHFLRKDFDLVLKQMNTWSTHPNEHVRRLSSEGLRPRLPWSFQLKNLVANPEPALPILRRLSADPSLYVRKSVANHLNDISKNHPQLLINELEDWDTKNEHTLWIVKQGLRTLVKKGNPEALRLLGFQENPKVQIPTLGLGRDVIVLGDPLTFNFEIQSTSDEEQRLAVDYCVHYMKGNGMHSPKVFKLKELVLAPGHTIQLTKKHAFKDFTTRKHYKGQHFLEIQVNGKKLASTSFELRL